MLVLQSANNQDQLFVHKQPRSLVCAQTISIVAYHKRTREGRGRCWFCRAPTIKIKRLCTNNSDQVFVHKQSRSIACAQTITKEPYSKIDKRGEGRTQGCLFCRPPLGFFSSFAAFVTGRCARPRAPARISFFGRSPALSAAWLKYVRENAGLSPHAPDPHALATPRIT